MWHPSIDKDVYKACYVRCSLRYRDIMNKLKNKEREQLEQQERERVERES